MTNIFCYENGKLIERWFPQPTDERQQSIVTIAFWGGPPLPCTEWKIKGYSINIIIDISSDIFLKKTFNGEDNTELGELNNKKLEKVLRGLREAFPDAELEYGHGEWWADIYEYGFKQ